MSKTESEIQNAIRLALVGKCILFRSNVGKFQMKDGRWFDTGLPPGFSDLFGVLPDGRALFIEVKSEKGKPSEAQEKFIETMRKQGAIAGICRSAKDALDLIQFNRLTREKDPVECRQERAESC